jgi:hypothetical protein
MDPHALDRFIHGVRSIWGPPSTEVIAASQQLLNEFTKVPVTEEWLAELNGIQGSKELYRDPKHGFLLLAHVEKEGLYRKPHDHGTGWVIYAVQHGEMEMGTYGRLINPKGELEVIRRELYRVHAGESRVYLPGDIHDTRCISESVLMFRFTSCDLKKEAQEGRMIHYTSTSHK